MAVSGARARRFISPGGASSVFQRQRGMVAPAPIRSALPAEDDRNSRTGKASGRDYGNFFSKKRNVSAIKGAVNALKGLLVGTFIAAKSLGATLKNVVGQINGFVKDKGAGLLGKIGTVGIIAAVVVGVAAIFGPQIKKAFDFLKTKAEDIFQDVKKRLDDADKNLESLYNTIKDFVNVTVVGIIKNINGAIGAVNNVIKAIKPIAGFLANNPLLIGPLSPLKSLGKALTGLPTLPDPFIPLDKLPKLPEYRDVLGDKGINFLSGFDSLGDLGGSMMSGLGGMLAGGLDSITGVMGDFLNNFFADMGLTDKANDALSFFGMGTPFGARRDVGSGQGISSLVPDGMFDGLGSMFGLGGNQQQQSGAPPDYAPGRSTTSEPTSTGNLNENQAAFIETVKQLEGAGYNTVYGGANVPELTQMTLGELYEAAKLGGDDLLPERLGGGRIPYHKDKHNSTASGAVQLMPETLMGLVRGGKFSMDDKFDENTQNAIMLELARQRGVDTSKPLTVEDMRKLGPEWASFTPYHGQTNRTAGQSLNAYQQNLKKIQQFRKQQSNVQPAPAPQSQSAKDAFIPPKKKASSVVIPASQTIASAPRRPRPDIAPENVSAETANPSYTHHSSTYYDPSTLPTLVAA